MYRKVTAFISLIGIGIAGSYYFKESEKLTESVKHPAEAKNFSEIELNVKSTVPVTSSEQTYIPFTNAVITSPEISSTSNTADLEKMPTDSDGDTDYAQKISLAIHCRVMDIASDECTEVTPLIGNEENPVPDISTLPPYEKLFFLHEESEEYRIALIESAKMGDPRALKTLDVYRSRISPSEEYELSKLLSKKD